MEKPFVKLFKTIDCNYIYDVNNNSIIRVNEEIYNKIRKLQDEELSDISDEGINKLIQRGYLNSNRAEIEIRHPLTDITEEYTEGNLCQLVLQVTQNCNLRCKYCVYSGSYVNRTHTLKRMKYETAIKAVDFYYKRSFRKKEAVIGFYGGEPLLEFELIKSVVKYAENLFAGKEVRFNMTTNATLLNNIVADFLVKHNFNLTISLDGPKNIHNKSRVFADNETGTFDCIMKNINELLERYPGYEKNINFNAVLDVQNDYKCSSDFFTYEFMKNSLVTVTTLNENGNKQEILYSDAFDINYRYEIFKCLLKYVGKLSGEYTSKVAESHVASLKTDLHERINTPYRRGTICHPSGPCIAGVTRLFVNVDGIFYPCEKVNEQCNAYIIGDVNNGFDIAKIKELLNIGQLTAEQCKNCWAIEYCSSCASGIDDGDVLCPEKKLSKCHEIKKGCELRMIEYCILREMGCKFD